MSPIDFTSPTWDAWFRISTLAAFVFGGLGVLAAFASAWIGYKITDATQRNANILIARAGVDAAKANEEAAKARLELEQVKVKHADRKITEKQRILFVEVLKNVRKEGAQISCTRHSEESVSYSEDFDKLLTEAGFTVTNNRGEILQGLNGLIVAVNNPDSSRAKIILEAFSSIGIKAQGKTMPGIPECDVSVMVGYKPLEAITGDATSSNAPSAETK